MASSSIDIINKALVLLGANTISSISEGTAESTAVSVVYDSARQACLRIHPWNFATKEAELAAVSGGSDYKHAYQFNLPSDAIRLLTVYNDPSYKLKGRSIYSNFNSCNIRYIFDNTDVASWDSSFCDVVSYRIASELAYSLTKSTSLSQAMEQQFARRVIEAKAIDASEDIEDSIAPYDSAFIGVRY